MYILDPLLPTSKDLLENYDQLIQYCEEYQDDEEKQRLVKNLKPFILETLRDLVEKYDYKNPENSRKGISKETGASKLKQLVTGNRMILN